MFLTLIIKQEFVHKVGQLRRRHKILGKSIFVLSIDPFLYLERVIYVTVMNFTSLIIY